MRRQEGTRGQVMRSPSYHSCCCCCPTQSTHALHEEKHSHQCVLHLLSLQMQQQGRRDVFYSTVWGFPQPNLKELVQYFYRFWVSDVMNSYNNQITNE